MKKSSILFLLLLISLQAAHGQEVPRQPSKWALVITLFSEAWAIPSTRFVKKPIHPGISIGTTYTLRETAHSVISLGGTLGYFYHRNLQHNLHFIPSLGYEYKLPAGFRIGTSVGLGYSHSIYPTPVYKLKGDTYKRVTDWGKAALLPSLDVNLGYTFNRTRINPVTVFTKYQFMADWPYAPENTFPVMPHTLFHAGVKFNPFK